MSEFRLGRFWRTFAFSWALIAALMTSWSLATPIGAAPDEPAHLVKAAAVVRGEFIGDPGPAGQLVRVPKYIGFVINQTCFAFDGNKSASCALPVPGNADRTVTAATTAGLYNPLYYLLTGWPSLLFRDSTGIFAMRIMSAMLVAFFCAISIAVLSTWKRPTILIVSALSALTPMVLFLGGVVNPNSLEIGSTLAAFVTFYSVARGSSALPSSFLWTVFGVSAVVAVNMRGLSVLWLAVAAVAVLAAVPRDKAVALIRQRSALISLGATVAASVLALVWVLVTNSLGAGLDGSGPPSTAPGVGTSALGGFLYTLLSTAEYSEGIIGVFGWLDTPAPPFAFFVWSVLIGGLLVWGAVSLLGRRLVTPAVLLGAVILLPALLQGLYITRGGIIWQGRYILPLFVCLVVAVGVGLAETVELAPSVQFRLSTLVTAGWVSAQFYSFATAGRRYAVGLDRSWGDLRPLEWQPPGGLALSLGLYAAVLVAAGCALVFYYKARRPENPRDLRPKHTSSMH